LSGGKDGKVISFGKDNAQIHTVTIGAPVRAIAVQGQV
jgi:hypothetical protein